MATNNNKQSNNGGRKRNSSVRRRSAKRNREHPQWLFVCIAIVLSTLIISATYIFFFRPYLFRFRPCYGKQHYNICMPIGHSVYGIDISRYQGSIDWEKFGKEMPSEAPISFIYMKATEGSDFTDVKFEENFADVRKHGYLRGAYHYFNTRSTGDTQADFYIKTVKLRPGDLPPMVDVEDNPKDKEKFQNELKIWLTKVEKHYGVKPIIYSPRKFKHKYLNHPFFKNYPSWVAHFYVEHIDEEPDWLIWQCSDIGELPGFKEKVDINIFNGNIQQLHSLKIK